MEAVHELVDRIRELVAEHEQLDRAVANLPDNDSDSDPDETVENAELRKDHLAKSKDIQLQLKSVPDGECAAIMGQ